MSPLLFIQLILTEPFQSHLLVMGPLLQFALTIRPQLFLVFSTSWSFYLNLSLSLCIDFIFNFVNFILHFQHSLLSNCCFFLIVAPSYFEDFFSSFGRLQIIVGFLFVSCDSSFSNYYSELSVSLTCFSIFLLLFPIYRAGFPVMFTDSRSSFTFTNETPA